MQVDGQGALQNSVRHVCLLQDDIARVSISKYENSVFRNLSDQPTARIGGRRKLLFCIFLKVQFVSCSLPPIFKIKTLSRVSVAILDRHSVRFFRTMLKTRSASALLCGIARIPSIITASCPPLVTVILQHYVG